MLDEARRGLLIGLKAYKTAVYGMETIAAVFPNLIADLLKMFMAKNAMGNTTPIGYNWNQLMEFQINLGNAIAAAQFDYLDNIVIQFLQSYSYVLPPYQFFIEFPDEEIQEYTEICNGFKGKEWDDIVDDFVDATYEFFGSGKMFNTPLE